MHNDETWNVMDIGSGHVASISGVYIGITRSEAVGSCARLRQDPHHPREAVVMDDREISAWIQGRMPCHEEHIEESPDLYYCSPARRADERCHLDLCALLLSTGPSPGWIEPSPVCTERTWS